ncbi:sensor histidine kinase [Amycolatopsis dongchuanensis]|uniref:histidine kinase n=2 Tax=Amycolatopsis TaxID=1813 RepID=A0A1I4AUW6_9PSEU|nr:Histidine kinase-, DNA gyrase B-, and HSP90-like ATPase [Amycolatopsis sacchari]
MRGVALKAAIRRSADATGALAGALRTALPALLSLAVVPVSVLLLPVLPTAAEPLRYVTGLERNRRGIPAPYRRIAPLRDPATWRDVAWLVVHGVTGLAAGILAVALWPAILSSVTTPLYWWLVPDGVTALFVDVRTWPQALTLPFVQAACYAAILYWLVPLAARAQEWTTRTLLGPTDHDLLVQQVERLTETRTEALESHGAELRRIERDLHDGIQAQLVAVAVRLGLAERALAADPDTARSLLNDAQSGIEDSLGNLRGVIRGIYPPILADRGLGGAVHALASGQRVPVAVHIPEDLPRPPAPIEAAAYFVVAESLTNVTKHSSAQHAEVTVERDGPNLRVVVRDDGQGGATEGDGSGLLGIRRRVAALDGTARIESPAGEGTTIEVLLPCG